MRQIMRLSLSCLLLLAVEPPLAAENEPSLTKLVEQLQSKDAMARVRAADALGHLGPQAKDAVEALVRALGDDDEHVQWHAARALGSIGPTAAPAVAALTERLKDEGALVRAYAAFALGRIGGPSAGSLSALAAAIKDPDKTVRRSAVKAIWAIKPPPAIVIPLFVDVLKNAEPGVVVPALDALAESGEQAVPLLLEALKEKQAQYWACLVLAEMGAKAKTAVPAIAELLANDDAGVRREALLALGSIGSDAQSAVPAMIKALDDTDFTVRYGAAFALGRIGPAAKAAQESLQKRTADSDHFLRAVSLWSLAKLDPKDETKRREAAKHLVTYLTGNPGGVRSVAAHALAELKAGDTDVIDAFIGTLGDKQVDVAAIAENALAQIGESAVKPLIRALENDASRIGAATTLGRIGAPAKAAIPALVTALGDKSAEVRREVLYALAAIGPDSRQALAAVVRSLASDPDAATRHAAAYALGTLGPAAKDAVPALRKSLEADDRFLVMVSAWALAKIEPKSVEIAELVLPILIESLKSEQEPVQLEAADALGSLGALAAEAVPALTASLDDDDESVRKAAAAALAKIQR